MDGEEISEARWFSREDLRAAFESGEVLPPFGISIAARLIELWYGKPLPQAAADRRADPGPAARASWAPRAGYRVPAPALRGGDAAGGPVRRSALIFSLTWASEGLVSVEPSAKSTVGTVWLPPLAFSTNVAEAGSCSMLISVYAMPSRSIWPFSRRQ